ncbi:alpha/beta fold hydrolase [Reichenbachiella sp. MALMAid0571]|uniref:alpha/beta hydrolase n=1 Tax=Reichenbachiella sp. MALMAid0571 TaxID=3143939 RepID=UPI0032DE4F99
MDFTLYDLWSIVIKRQGNLLLDKVFKNTLEMHLFLFNKTAGRLTIMAALLYILSGCQQQKSSFSFHSHFSQAFKKEKNYTLYLPEGYNTSGSAYPVVYFFHGWGGRNFKSVDGSANLEYEMIKDLVDKYQVILVMWDGNMEEGEPRPYNVGNHHEVRFEAQMKDYFLELVDHIDNTYRTKTDRNSRGIIGFSMGGYMSFFLSGKYPDKVSAAVNLTGSPEFFIGHPDNHTLYPLRYTFTNLKDVQLRFHNSSKGEISPLNREVHNGALWENDLNYQYWEFDGGHKIDDPGETRVFEMAMKFVTDAFRDPMPRKEKWSHYDLYSDFDVWDYSIKSDKKKPGFLYLKNVSQQGFGFYTQKWLPLGPPIGSCQTSINTAGIYKPKAEYTIAKYNKKDGSMETYLQASDGDGRLQFHLPGDGYEVGIYKKGDAPKLTFLDYQINENQKLLRIGKENKISLKIGNLGEMVNAETNIKLTLSTKDKSVSIENGVIEFLPKKGERMFHSDPFAISANKTPPTDGSPASIRFLLSIEYDSYISEEEFIIPVFFDVPDFNSVSIDDGVVVNDAAYGTGNGDGKVAPGEEIMVYTNGHRTQVFTDDPYVDHLSERLHDEMTPAKWDDGITLSSIIKIAEDCPVNHKIELLARYETKVFDPIEREVKWGKIVLTVSK